MALPLFHAQPRQLSRTRPYRALRHHRSLRGERLESRHLLAGGLSDELAGDSLSPMNHDMHEGGMTHVEVTDTAVITHHDAIPRFAAEPTLTAVKHGYWSSPDTWDGGRVPAADEIVRIPAETVVIYDVDSAARLDAVEVGGLLWFHPRIDTSIWLNELMVLPSGSLVIGTEQTPISAGVTSEIVFTDTPGSNGLHEKTGDLANPGVDPSQYGNGLIVLGHLGIHGADKTPFARATHNLHPGTSSIVVDAAVNGWQTSDELVVPETSQTIITYTGTPLQETETVVLAGVQGTEVQLDGELNHHHHGISDNEFGIERYPHVANLSRNVIVRSENPDGVRGHVMATGNASINISNAEFRSLGRTSADAVVHSTLRNPDGSLLQIGSNQIGRYAIHLHHATQPFEISGSVIRDGLKWGLAVHGSNHGVIANNVVFDIDGAGIVTENGKEEGNLFANNVVIQINGGHQTGMGTAGAMLMTDAAGNRFVEMAADGSGFWLRSSENTFVGNTVYDAAGYGFNFNGYFRSPSLEGPLTHRQLDGFSGNETVSSKGGLWFSFSQGDFSLHQFQPQSVTDFLAWHVSEAGIEATHENNLKFDDVTVIGDPAASSANFGSGGSFEIRSLIGASFGRSIYPNLNFELTDLRVTGANVGIKMPTRPGDNGIVLRRATLGNYVNIAFPAEADVNSMHASDLSFLPSRVGRINESMPVGVANVWHEQGGTLEYGWEMIDKTAPLGTAPELRYDPDSRVLLLSGDSGDDDVWVREKQGAIWIEMGIHHEYSGAIDLVYRMGFDPAQVDYLLFLGEAGNDRFQNDSEVRALVSGGDGNDILIGGRDADIIRGNAGNDVIFGREGDDYLVGGEGEDLIFDGPGVDQVFADFP